MNDVGRYRKLYVRLWRDPGFRALSEGEKIVALYLLCGPQTNRCGCYCLSIATAAEDLGMAPETVKKRLAKVSVTFGWLFDADARVFYIPSWWAWNQPENCNVIKGALKDLNEAPPSALVDAFAGNVEMLSDRIDKDGRTILQTFVEGLRQRLPNRSPNQDQYPEHLQKQKREPSALRAVAVREEPNDAKTVGLDERLLRFARTVKRDAPHADVDYLCEALVITCNAAGVPCDRSDALKALAS